MARIMLKIQALFVAATLPLGYDRLYHMWIVWRNYSPIFFNRKPK